MSCSICLEDLNTPVSLPCGHIFCQDCLKRAVLAVQPYSTLHACPTCRSLYNIAPLDLSTVPPNLRPHVTPTIRRVYLDLPSKRPRDDTATPQSSLYVELARMQAENEALRHNCMMWRRRAEVHSAATLGLLELSRTAKDQALLASRQRDEVQKQYVALRRAFTHERAHIRTMLVAAHQHRLKSNGLDSQSGGRMTESRTDQSPSLPSDPIPLVGVPTTQTKNCSTDDETERSRKRRRVDDFS